MVPVDNLWFYIAPGGYFIEVYFFDFVHSFSRGRNGR